MKKAFKLWYTYVIALAIVIVICAIAIIPRICVVFLGSQIEWNSNLPFTIIMVSGVLLILIGFVSQDILRARVRHKTKNWDGKLDDVTIFKAWKIFAPFLLSGALLLIIGSILSLFKF